MANKEHLAWLGDGVEAWNARREQVEFTPDLHRARLAHAQLSGANLSYADLSNAILTDADLSSADLSGKVTLSGAKLGYATLTGAILRDVDLTRADLTRATLTGAILRDVNLTRADLTRATLTDSTLIDVDLTRAKLIDADLIGARLDRTDLSKSVLFSTRTAPPPHGIPFHIESVVKFIEYIKNIISEESVLYFRGEGQSNWTLRPAIARKENSDMLEHERDMLDDLISHRPGDFSSANSSLDRWMVAQHHGLKTRFLDITKNPLVALFYACEKQETIGRLRIFAVPKFLIKQYNSDAIRIVSNFARLSYSDQMALLGNDPSDIAFERAKERLLQLIMLERPYFPDWIDVRDLYRVFVVEPQQSIERIRTQSGAFLVSVFHDQFEAHVAARKIRNLPIYDEHELRIPKESKEGILRDLRTLGITRETLFPGLDESAKAITERYKPKTTG